MAQPEVDAEPAAAEAEEEAKPDASAEPTAEAEPTPEADPEAGPTAEAEPTAETEGSTDPSPDEPARADRPSESPEGEADEGAEAELAADPPIDAGEKRPVPDYDGRGDDPTTAGDVLIWIPRGIFYPVYLVAEYVIRWPLGKLTVAAEKHDIPQELEQFFTFGPHGNYGIVPSFLIDFGLRPSIGLYFFGDDIAEVKGLGVRSHLAFGGPNWYRATGSVRYDIDQETSETHLKFVQLKGVYSHRPDWLYWGQGPRTVDEHESAFTMQEIGGELSYRGGFWRSSYLLAHAGVRDVVFKDDFCCAPRSLVTAVDRGLFPKPEVFDDGYLIGYAGLEASLDTRPRRFAYDGDVSDHVSPPGHGLKAAGRALFAGGLRETNLPTGESKRPLFLRYGGTLGGFVDLYRHRVIGLQAVVDFVDPLGDDAIIPFSELADLGGARPLRGFWARRLIDRSTAAAILEYRWPIWVWLDGSIHYALGNAFGKHFEDFELELLRQSFGIGFKASAAEDHTFELLVAGGTRTFEAGGGVENFRFVFGSTAGF
jgi:hypothetical protein